MGFPEMMKFKLCFRPFILPKNVKCVPLTARANSENNQSKLADFCKALGHPIRVEIIKILLEKGECISGDLAEAFDKAHSTISEHLKILKEANLVLGTIDGPKRCYCVNPDALKQMKQLLNLLMFAPECCKPTAKKRKK